MAISFVNGFLCTSCCDVAKAKQGEDPHPSTHASILDPTRTDDGAARLDQPAVTFGGSLTNAGGAAAGTSGTASASATAPSPPAQGSFIDRLA